MCIWYIWYVFFVFSRGVLWFFVELGICVFFILEILFCMLWRILVSFVILVISFCLFLVIWVVVFGVYKVVCLLFKSFSCFFRLFFLYCKCLIVVVFFWIDVYVVVKCLVIVLWVYRVFWRCSCFRCIFIVSLDFWLWFCVLDIKCFYMYIVINMCCDGSIVIDIY